MTTQPTVRLPPIAFLGAGSMARSIIAGLRRPGVSIEGDIRTTNRSARTAAELAGVDGLVARATETDPHANISAVNGAGIVVIAVKPALVLDLVQEIAGALDPGTVVVSVAPGVALSAIESMLPDSIAAIRAMPNTAASVGHSVTGLSEGARTLDGDPLALIVSLFETSGDVLIVPESQLDALSTISGSGPAYVFLLIEHLTAAAIDKGFTPQEAAVMARGTFRGASEMLATSGKDPAALRGEVTSPNGTTERAIAVLLDAQLKEVFDRATDAALARARELATRDTRRMVT